MPVSTTLVHLSTGWLLSVVLLSVRLGLVLVMTPVLGAMALPVRIRVLLVFSLAAALVSGLNLPVPAVDAEAMVTAGLYELVWGGLLAFGLQAAYGAFIVGGRLLDLQMGFGIASLFDPATRTQGPLIGVALQMYATLWFLLVNGHHVVLRGLAKSLELVPLGSPVSGISLSAVLHQFALTFSLGLILVGATAACLFLVDVAISLASRLLPQANVFVLSTQIKLFVGLSLLSLSIPYMQPTIERIFGTVFDFWEVLLRR